MSSSVAEQREPRARNATVSEEALTVDLTDGRTVIVPLVWYRAKKAQIQVIQNNRGAMSHLREVRHENRQHRPRGFHGQRH